MIQNIMVSEYNTNVFNYYTCLLIMVTNLKTGNVPFTKKKSYGYFL